MTPPNRLQEIKDRLAKASPGPWEVVQSRSALGKVVREQAGGNIGSNIAEIDPHNGVWDCEDNEDGCEEVRARWECDLEFIAAAPADIAWLIGEVQRLGEDNQALDAEIKRAVVAYEQAMCDKVQVGKERDELAAVVAEKDQALFPFTTLAVPDNNSSEMTILNMWVLVARLAYFLTPPQALARLERRVRAETYTSLAQYYEDLIRPGGEVSGAELKARLWMLADEGKAAAIREGNSNG